jgi:hypothetical protein
MNYDWTEEKVPCKKCGRIITKLDVFPLGLCFDCHAKRFDTMTTEECADYCGKMWRIKR